jgi:hypothetical protein
MILPVLAKTSADENTAPRSFLVDPPRPHRSLADPWRISTLDADSVRKRAAQFHEGFGTERHENGVQFYENELTGPFLLAAALSLNDTETMRLVYGDICDDFEQEDAALQLGVDYLAARQFAEGLGAFQRFADAEAGTLLQSMEMFAPYSDSDAELGLLLKKSRKLAAVCAQRLAAPPATGPLPVDPDARPAYWIAILPELKGEAYDTGNSPRLRNLGIDFRRRIDNAAIANLCDLGRAALPALVEAAADSTPTHLVILDDYPYEPLPGWISVGEVSQEIIQRISEDAGLPLPWRPPDLEAPSQARDRLRAWLKTLPPAKK